MKLTSTQKQQLLQLYTHINSNFFTFLNSTDYEKKMKKLSNAKDEYVKFGYDEEALFLLDETLFGSADYGMVITDSFVFYKEMLEDSQYFLITENTECRYIEDNKISINYQELSFALLGESTSSVVKIINKLSEFYKENIIKEKNLNLHLNITIPYSLFVTGGKYKDKKSGYTIPISKGIKDGAVLSWDEYGKSYGGIKGKLTVTINIEKPKPKPTSQSIRKPIKKPKPIPKKIAYCINCGKKHENPTSYNCSFCGKPLTKKIEDTKEKKPTELEVQIKNDNDIDIDDLELIVTCVNCNNEIKNYSSDICPHCGENANVKKKIQKIKTNKHNLNEFFININNELVVRDIKEYFKTQTGLVLRVYESSRKQARGNKKLINLATKQENIRIATRMKIETIIEIFKKVGVKVRITSFDDNKFCNSSFTLAKAKEKYGEK